MPSDVVGLPPERPLLPLIGPLGRFDVRRVPLAGAREADIDLRDRPGSRPGLAPQIPLPMVEGQSPLDAILTFFEKRLRFRGLLALAEEDSVASQLDDGALSDAARQIRARSLSG